MLISPWDDNHVVIVEDITKELSRRLRSLQDTVICMLVGRNILVIHKQDGGVARAMRMRLPETATLLRMSLIRKRA